jgi:hypothetical protein
MDIVRRLWWAAKYVVGGLASLGGLACLAFVAGGFVWGIAKGITGTMRDPSGWNEWLSIVGGGVLILFGLVIVLRAIRESLKYILVLPEADHTNLLGAGVHFCYPGWCCWLGGHSVSLTHLYSSCH